MTTYQTYLNHLKRYKGVWMRCLACHEKMLFETFHEHVSAVHGLKVAVQCAYCLGKKAWPWGKKKHEDIIKHLMKCLRECMEKNSVVMVEETVAETLPVEKDEVVVCKECREFRPNPGQMNGRVCDRTSEYMGFYDSCFEKPDWWKTDWELFDESKGMYNDQIGIFRRFLLPNEDPDHLIWWHIMVKVTVWHVFVEAMEKIKDEIVVLPYWCLCDGLGSDRVVHRHMIFACTPESSFVKIWKNEVKHDLDMSGDRCKYAVRIKDVFHLAHCIQYVSQHKASCDGVKIRDQLDENKAKLSHYRMNRPASPHATAFRSMLFEGGMEELVKLTTKKKNVVGWVDEAKKLTNRWAVSLNVTGFKFLNCVIPLRRGLEPTNEETSMHLTWMKHRRLYLKENAELLTLSEEDWYAHQVRRGNTFQTIGEEMYVYGLTQQNMMNQLVEQKKQLKRKWVTEWEQRYEEMDEKYKKERMEKDVLKLEITDLKSENFTLKRDNQDLKKENQDLKKENYDLKHKQQPETVNNINIQTIIQVRDIAHNTLNIKKDNDSEDKKEREEKN